MKRINLTPEEEPSEEKPADNLHRNQLAATALASCLLTLVLAAYLGAYSSADFENLSDWFAVIIAAGAAGISLYAVLLVAKTLKATQETLKATQEMAADAKRIGDAQLRPWLLLDECHLTNHDHGLHIKVTLRNFGYSPASFIEFVTNVYTFKPSDDYDSDYFDEDETMLKRWNSEFLTPNYVGQGKELQASLFCNFDNFPDDTTRIILDVGWSYSGPISGKKERGEDKWIISFNHELEQYYLEH